MGRRIRWWYRLVIRVDKNRLSDLSMRLRRLEYDISDITNQVSRMAKMEASSQKYRNTEYTVRRACDRVIASAEKVGRSTVLVCDKLDGQSRVLSNAVSAYGQYDRNDKVNNGVIDYLGSSMRRFFGNYYFDAYSTIVRSDLSRFL